MRILLAAAGLSLAVPRRRCTRPISNWPATTEARDYPDDRYRSVACGDNVINRAGEACDGNDLAGATCASLGFQGGSLSCTNSCAVDTTGCLGSTCTAGAGGYTDPSGCECQKDAWRYNAMTFCNGVCGKPDSDPNGPWCLTKGTCNGSNYGYCTPPATGSSCAQAADGYLPPAGCACLDKWSYGNQTFSEAKCANPDNDSDGLLHNRGPQRRDLGDLQPVTGRHVAPGHPRNLTP